MSPVSVPEGHPEADLWTTMRTARAIRRFRPDPVDDAVLARCLEAATWAPSGSNEQSWRFLVLRSPEVRRIIGPAYRSGWDAIAGLYDIERPAPDDRSRRARMTRSLLHLVDHVDEVPAFVLFCTRPTPGFPELLVGGSIYPAVQNFLLAARAQGLGAVVSSWFTRCEPELRQQVGVPDDWVIAALVAVGWPVGRHGPVRRRPVDTVTAADHWDHPFLDPAAVPPAPGRVRSAGLPPLAERTITRVLADCAERDPDRPAVTSADEVVSRSELFERARLVGGWFRRLGDQPRVALMLDDHLDHVLAVAGLCVAGGVQVPVNTAYRGALLAHVLADSGVETLVVDARYLPRVAEVRDRVPGLRRIVVRGEATLGVPHCDLVPFAALGDGAPCSPAHREPWDLYGIMYTSGTTGVSKGVLTTHGHAFGYASPAGLQAATPDDVSLVVMPLFHVSGQLWGVVNALMAGAEAVVAGGFHVSTFWPQVRRHRVTFTTMAGAMARFLQRAAARPDDRDHPLRRVCVAPIPPDVDDFLARFGIDEYCTGYGSTETGAPLSSPTGRPPGSVGWARPEWRARVVDAHDRDVAAGEVGELLVRSDEPWLMMTGYHGRPEATAAAWRNGWFHTGDGARQTADGEVYLVDRIDDVIRRRGENVSSQEVEAQLTGHPGVRECAVVAVPSADTDHEVLAVVVADDAAGFDPGGLVELARQHLPYFMVPRYVRTVAELPRTSTGKVRKQQLRDDGVTPDTWDRYAAGITVSRHDA
ncbi:MAG TPA: AMP-binding protein [Acidimicrobiales bacterium]|nr:AMP-binding protein [Acidimicrobiales bacterium]